MLGWVIQVLKHFPGIPDTGEMWFSGVWDTGEMQITGVPDTGESWDLQLWTMEKIAGVWHSSEMKNVGVPDTDKSFFALKQQSIKK